VKLTVAMRDFAIVTFAVDPQRLAAHLPLGFEPQRFELDSGAAVAFVSAVAFRVSSLELPGRLALPVSFVQTNYRAYATYARRRCVWFFGSTLDWAGAALARTVWKMPWYRARSRLEAVWQGERCTHYALESHGAYGAADFHCSGTGTQSGRLDGFTGAPQTAEVLTGPPYGYARLRDGTIAGFGVTHAALKPQLAAATRARFSVFEGLGLVPASAAPHSVLLQRRAPPFATVLPPTKTKGPDSAPSSA
jgi:hypothetical protein